MIALLSKMALTWLFLQLVIADKAWCESVVEETVVHVSQGKLMGMKLKSVNQKTPFYSFQGIPFAEPPVGELRFMPPQTITNWDGTFNATNDRVRCPQEDPLIDRFPSGDEDCLILNVYTPRISKEPTTEEGKKLPVMFWIHGGGFASGSSSTLLFGPDFFMNEDVILVTTNYRLGALGFLNTGDEVIPGNMGLKDIVLALKWVQNNIQVFNGDKNKVTIFGNNAGGTTVSLLMQSPLATGLFHKAICQSGVFELPQLFSENPRKRAFNLSKLLYKNSDTSEELLKNLKKVEASEIVKATPKTFDSTEVRDSQKSILPFGPSVENVTKHDEAFLTTPPDDFYSTNSLSTNIPLMIGFNSREAIVFLRTLINDPEILEKLNYNFQFSVPLRGLEFIFNSVEYKYVAEKIKQFYFQHGVITDKSMDEYVDYVSDGIFYPIHKMLTRHLKASFANTYFYRFSFDGRLNFFKKSILNDSNGIKGATNGDEICYLFKCEKLDETYQELLEIKNEPYELQVSKQMVRLWTNFAKFGNPTPHKDEILHNLVWKPVSPGAYNFLDIDKDLMMDANPGSRNVDFWDGIFARYSKDYLIKGEL